MFCAKKWLYMFQVCVVFHSLPRKKFCKSRGLNDRCSVVYMILHGNDQTLCVSTEGFPQYAVVKLAMCNPSLFLSLEILTAVLPPPSCTSHSPPAGDLRPLHATFCPVFCCWIFPCCAAPREGGLSHGTKGVLARGGCSPFPS